MLFLDSGALFSLFLWLNYFNNGFYRQSGKIDVDVNFAEFCEDRFQNAVFRPASISLVNSRPFPKTFGKGSPCTTIFSDVNECVEKSVVVNLHVSALGRQLGLNMVVLALCKFHRASIVV